jgi:hypothetical protein
LPPVSPEKDTSASMGRRCKLWGVTSPSAESRAAFARRRGIKAFDRPPFSGMLKNVQRRLYPSADGQNRRYVSADPAAPPSWPHWVRAGSPRSRRASPRLRSCDKNEIGVSAPCVFSHLRIEKADFANFFTPSEALHGWPFGGLERTGLRTVQVVSWVTIFAQRPGIARLPLTGIVGGGAVSPFFSSQGLCAERGGPGTKRAL